MAPPRPPAMGLATRLLVTLLVNRAAAEGQLIDGVVHFKFAEHFKPMLEKLETTTFKVYRGLPLADVPEYTRDAVLTHLAHALDNELNPSAAISAVEIDDTGANGGCAASEVDWLRGETRVLLRTSMLDYKGLKGGWRIYMCDLKIDPRNPTFDELWLAIYTPKGVYIYQHDMVTALKRDKERASSYMKLAVPGHVADWRRALDMLLPELKACKRLAMVPFDDPRFQAAFEAHDPRMILGQGAYEGVPLRTQLGYDRDLSLQAMARAVEKLRFPECRLEVRNADAGRDYDWQRTVIETDLRHDRHSPALGVVKVVHRSATLTYDHDAGAWGLRWGDLKFPIEKVKGREERPFDELYVSFYTPRGVYVYKHNLEIGVKMVDLAKGKKPVQATMYESLISAEAGIQSWKKALDEHILPALDESGCSWVGFIDFEVEDTLIDPYADSRLRARALHAPSFQPNRCVAVSQPQCTLDADTDEWRAAWLDRFEDWWMLTPYREGLKTCLGALGLHLAARLERLRQAAFFATSGDASPATFSTTQGDAACDWVSEMDEGLALPDFPPIEHFQFELPSVPLIPRLLPNTERLLGLGGGGAPSSRHAPGDTTFSVSNAAGSGAHLYSAGAGASGAALAIVVVAGLRSLRRRAGRLERRAASK